MAVRNQRSLFTLQAVGLGSQKYLGCVVVFYFHLFSLSSAAFFNFHLVQKRNKALEKLV